MPIEKGVEWTSSQMNENVLRSAVNVPDLGIHATESHRMRNHLGILREISWKFQNRVFRGRGVILLGGQNLYLRA